MKLLATEALQSLPAVILPRLIALFGSTTPAIIADIRHYSQQRRPVGDEQSRPQTQRLLHQHGRGTDGGYLQGIAA